MRAGLDPKDFEEQYFTLKTIHVVLHQKGQSQLGQLVQVMLLFTVPLLHPFSNVLCLIL